MNATAVTTLFPQLLIRRMRNSTVAPRFHHLPVETRSPVAPVMERRDVATLLRLASWIFSARAANKGITLRVDAPVAGLYAVCDEIRLQRVLENLLAHAIDSSPPNATVTLAARQAGEQVCFGIDDEGLGVAPADLAALLATQNKETALSAIDNEEGTELEVSGRIVAAHGGEISMQNRPEGGTHVEFLLPSRASSKMATFTTSTAPQTVRMGLASTNAA